MNACMHAHPSRPLPLPCRRRPQVIEELKSGWIQWLATFVALWWLLRWAEWFVFYFRLVSVRVVSDVAPKNQRF